MRVLAFLALATVAASGVCANEAFVPADGPKPVS